MKSPLSGVDVNVEEVDFDAPAEPWTTLKLTDGTTLKLRPTITKVVRFEDYDQHGDPIYMVYSGQPTIRVLGVRKELKGKPLVPDMKPAPSSVEVG